jgi:hypothetical protein
MGAGCHDLLGVLVINEACPDILSISSRSDIALCLTSGKGLLTIFKGGRGWEG